MLSVRAFNQFTPVAHVSYTPPGWQEVVRAMENALCVITNSQFANILVAKQTLLVADNVINTYNSPIY